LTCKQYKGGDKVLRKILGNTYYLPGPVNIGIYDHGDGCCTAIDTGIDKDSGRKILKALEKEKLTLVRIINTHAHADHFGGNAFLVRRLKVEVWAPPIEAGIILYPELEPLYLYSAQPLPDLQTKFLQAAASPVDKIIEPGEKTAEGLEILPLPGHSPGQIGVATPDGVLFSGDAYFAIDTLEKYFLPYFVDIPRAKETISRLLATNQYRYYLPCHGILSDDPQKTLAANLERLQEIDEFILSSLKRESKTREALLAELILTHNLLLNPAQYHLYNSTLGAHLSGLVVENKLEFIFCKGKMHWQLK
jgi:glyoxylase-like metal-dependent hydrolase (beta-lactamase superfamily II)